MFCTVLSRSPAHSGNTPEFEKIFMPIKDQDPYALFFVADFNGHFQPWWQIGDSTTLN